MKKELLVSVLTAIMAMGSSSLHAQAKLVVTPLNGGQTGEYALTDIQKITFGEDGMHVVGSNFKVEPCGNSPRLRIYSLSDLPTESAN
ncbi:hypothetical protein [Prevotella dentasini]|uniref:hypothetical protein n=1 Tax=Prevotella dentasini TaxID=589537 RepID=UPI001F41DCFE|nr:hypothetical protein [Prevotella dentasini]